MEARSLTVRGSRNRLAWKLVGVAVASAALVLVAVPLAANPAKREAPPKVKAVQLESIPGSAVKRVILSSKAAGRLGIETGMASEAPITRKQVVSGLVVPAAEQALAREPAASFKGFTRFTSASSKPLGRVALAGPTAPGGGSSVLVTLSQGEWDRLAKDQPARILPIATRGAPAGEILALPSGMVPREDAKRSMLVTYYKLQGDDHGLGLNDRVRVELQLSGDGEKKRVVPYAAVYYDATGAAWVYVSAQPLTFERQRVTVERIVGEQAVLSDGPSTGTTVVTVGAPLLYGAEIFGK